MNDNYQAVYDAVRSRMSHFNGDTLASEIARQFDFSHQAEMIKGSFLESAWELGRPSMLLKPKITIDGNKYCALYGDNLQDGVAGFGDSPALAFIDFDKNWNNKLK